MRKVLGLILAVASITFVASSAEARTSESAAQARIQLAQGRGRWNQSRRWNKHRPRIVTQTRIVQLGRRRFRETYQIAYLPNGRTQTRLISRVRIT